jgi:hypothetical protein
MAQLLYVSHVAEGLHSIAEVPEAQQERASAIAALNLHGNTIARMDGLQCLPALTALNLSSNSITSIECLAGLVHLTSLNLASNAIRQLRGLAGLRKLVALNVSYNSITCIAGISELHGSQGSLARLNLQHNQLASLQALAPLAGCLQLRGLKVGGNPATLSPAAYAALRQVLPQVQQLDEGEAFSLAVGWQMAQAQLLAHESRLEQQQQQQQQTLQLLPPPARAAASGRAAKKQAREQAGSGGSSTGDTGTSRDSSSSSMPRAVDAALAADADSGLQHQQREHDSDQQRRQHKQRPGREHGLKQQQRQGGGINCSTQTDESSATTKQLQAEAQALQQHIGRLLGARGLCAPLCLSSLACIVVACCAVHSALLPLHHTHTHTHTHTHRLACFLLLCAAVLPVNRGAGGQQGSRAAAAAADVRGHQGGGAAGAPACRGRLPRGVLCRCASCACVPRCGSSKARV